MADTSFIADELDARASLAAVVQNLEVCFMQFKIWDHENPTISTDLAEFGKLCDRGLSFIVSGKPENLRLRKRQIMGEEKWTFQWATEPKARAIAWTQLPVQICSCWHFRE